MIRLIGLARWLLFIWNTASTAGAGVENKQQAQECLYFTFLKFL